MTAAPDPQALSMKRDRLLAAMGDALGIACIDNGYKEQAVQLSDAVQAFADAMSASPPPAAPPQPSPETIERVRAYLENVAEMSYVAAEALRLLRDGA